MKDKFKKSHLILINHKTYEDNYKIDLTNNQEIYKGQFSSLNKKLVI
jgi:hypothetical protein